MPRYFEASLCFVRNMQYSRGRDIFEDHLVYLGHKSLRCVAAPIRNRWGLTTCFHCVAEALTRLL